jgi:DNA transformation protein
MSPNKKSSRKAFSSLTIDSHRFDDLFSEFGPVALRPFFGGEGIYAGDVMIGMVFDERLYFKTDETTRKAFLSEKSKPFSFLKRSTGETIVTGWYAVPERLYDDPEEFAQWARAALGVARSSPTGQKKRKAGAKSRSGKASGKIPAKEKKRR